MTDVAVPITIELPGLLSDLLGVTAITLSSATVRSALEEAVARYPALGVHLFDESGGLREHVLCFHNETNMRWVASLDRPVHEGDRITIIQAVSGG